MANMVGVYIKKSCQSLEFRKVTFEDVETPPIWPFPQTSGVDSNDAQLDDNVDRSRPVASRQTTRVFHLLHGFVLCVDFVMLMDYGGPSCYQEAMKANEISLRGSTQWNQRSVRLCIIKYGTLSLC